MIPNTKMSSSMLTNFNLPTQETSFSLNMSVGYDNHLDEVERIVLRVARTILNRIPAGSSPEPVVRFSDARGSSIDFSLHLRAKQLSDTYLLKHELLKAIHAEFRKERVQLPFAQHLVFQPRADSNA